MPSGNYRMRRLNRTCGKSKGSIAARIAKTLSLRRAVAAGTEWAASFSGRGEDDQKVREWLSTAATVPGFIGFAVGRTSFWDPARCLACERDHARGRSQPNRRPLPRVL